MVLDAARLLYLATRAGAEALGLETEIGDFRPGKAADFVYLRPPPGSVLDAAVRHADDPVQALAALFTLAGAGKRARSARRRGYRLRAGAGCGPATNDDARRAEREGSRRLRRALLGWIFEDSPWVAERAWERRPFASLDASARRDDSTVVTARTRTSSWRLLRAHPDLGAMVRLKPDTTDVDGAGADEMSMRRSGSRPAPASTRLTRDEFERLRALNAAYREKFGFPFLFAVKGSTKHDILDALERRLHIDARRGAQEALRQVYRIARFRLEETVGSLKGCDRFLTVAQDFSPVADGILERFASGPKRHYYGKGDVIVYRLNRDGSAPAGKSPVFGANVLMLVYGDAFWTTYTEGDNTGLIATDSMKNFIQRETMNFDGNDLEDYCWFLGEKFLATYPQVEGLQVSASEIPYAPARRASAFAPSGPDMRHRAHRDRSHRHRRSGVGPARLQAAAPRRQRVSRLRARRVHDAARPAQPAAAHVARSRMDAT